MNEDGGMMTKAMNEDNDDELLNNSTSISYHHLDSLFGTMTTIPKGQLNCFI